MYSTSSQMKFWMFSQPELEKLREEANQKYVENRLTTASLNNKTRPQFLTVEEEAKVRCFYEYELKNFCLEFQPPMPNYVLGTAMCYFKRCYVHTSVMDYHPKNILYACVYLACKVEEFNIPIEMFIKNMASVRNAPPGTAKKEAEKAADLLLSQELPLLEILHFHLTVHNPYRPVEGLIIDMKTRCPEMSDPEKLRKGLEIFLLNSLHTDACLIFPPSQIALSALSFGAMNFGGINVDGYVANKLSDSEDNMRKIYDHMQKLRGMVKPVEGLSKRADMEMEVRRIEQKLELCRNQENNPESIHYRRKVEEFSDDDDDSKFSQTKDSPMEHDILT